MIKIAEIHATNKERATELEKVFKNSGYTIATDEDHDHILYVLKDEKKSEKHYVKKVDTKVFTYYMKDYNLNSLEKQISDDDHTSNIAGYILKKYYASYDCNRKDYYIKRIYEKYYWTLE